MVIMFFSNKIKDVASSRTSIISDLVFKLKRDGKEIISMAAGELDLAPEKNIKSKAIEVIKDGNTRYAPVSGLEELKEAILSVLKNGPYYTAKPDAEVLTEEV